MPLKVELQHQASAGMTGCYTGLNFTFSLGFCASGLKVLVLWLSLASLNRASKNQQVEFVRRVLCERTGISLDLFKAKVIFYFLPHLNHHQMPTIWENMFGTFSEHNPRDGIGFLRTDILGGWLCFSGLDIRIGWNLIEVISTASWGIGGSWKLHRGI